MVEGNIFALLAPRILFPGNIVSVEITYHRIESEAGQAPGFECRNYECMVGRVFVELARCQQAAIGQIRIAVDIGFELAQKGILVGGNRIIAATYDIAIDVHVRKRPQVFPGRHHVGEVLVFGYFDIR